MKAAFAALAMSVACTLGGCTSDGSNTIFSEGFWHHDPNAVATVDQDIRNDKRPIADNGTTEADRLPVAEGHGDAYAVRSDTDNGRVVTSDGRVITSDGRVITPENRTTASGYDLAGPSRPSGQPNDATSGTVMNDTQLQHGNDKTRISVSLNSQDQQFLMEAAGGGLYEVQSGQKALQKSTDANVKMIAQHMVEDHSKANNALTALAQRKGVPAASLVPNADQVQMLSKLDGLNGAAFDREYLGQQRQAHIDAIAKFQSEANNGYDRDLRDFATSTLPTLRGHLDMINGSNNIGTER